ncbi:ATP-binding protein [Pseudonocardia humida]|uniref:LuxR family transcriptional regulator n=1 Tax=Pseudonocardia humida TaxID=2800819 RepID=A0ABT1AC91_9PSEU|nr:LuxR C-terminal-related transcriptional regulator [Pseudonocardia humida]MCO1660672.1 LuxR family transcriptional regulator [Pseudonocardia humida]
MTPARGAAGRHPAEPTTLVGRTSELDEVTRLLESARLVSLVGVGGVGKTRLAKRLAAQHATPAFDHVQLVDLAEVDQPGLVEATVAEAVGIRDEDGTLTVEDLSRRLADERALIVLDGCEHAIEGCAALAENLLATAPAVTVMTTSRRPLDVPGEHVLPVPPLAVPPPGEHPDPAELARYPAVELLLDRARAAAPGFELSAANAAAVAAVCTSLDGLPLALELAAVRLRVLSPAQLLDRLDGPHEILSSTHRNVHPRQRSLTALMDWSFRLCSDAERVLWARASIFRGGFDLSAAEQVCAGEGIDAGCVVDLVAGLVDKSVLLPEDHGTHVRYRLLETIRRYGLARLTESGEEERLRRRHREFLQRLVDEAAAHWFGPQDLVWLDRLRLEHASLRAALDSCTRSAADAAEGLRLATTFWLMWRAAGWVNEGRQWLDRLLAVAEPSQFTATALWVDGWLALVQGDHEHAVELLHRSADTAQHDDRVTPAFIDLFLGQAATRIGRLDEAEHRLRRALRVHRETSDPAGLALTAFRLAVRHAVAGDTAAAVASADESLRFCQDRRARWWSGYARWIRAVALWSRGDGAAALADAVESLKATRQHSDELGAAMALEVVAWATVGDNPDRAARILGALHRRWPDTGTALGGYGSLVDRHQRCCSEARRRLGAAGYAAAHADGADQQLEDVVELVLNGPRREEASTPLTTREHEVAELVAQGKTNKEISRALVIALRTAEAHVEHIRAKLGVSSRSQIAVWVVEQRGTAAPPG